MTPELIVAPAAQSPREPAIASSRIVRPEQLDDAGRAELFQVLLALNQQIFEGPWLKDVTAGLARGLHGKTTLQLYFDGQQQCVGYAAFLCDEFEQDGQPWTVFRAMTGLLPEYRGRQSVLGFYLAELVRYGLHHPRRRAFFFTPIVHISSYRVVARHAFELYPLPGRAVPEPIMSVMRLLATRYHLTPVKGAHPLVAQRPVWVRGSGQTNTRRGEAGDALDHFFQQINPRASEGYCVMTLAPLTMRQMAFSAARYAQTRASVLLRDLWSRWAEGLREHLA